MNIRIVKVQETVLSTMCKSGRAHDGTSRTKSAAEVSETKTDGSFSPQE